MEQQFDRQAMLSRVKAINQELKKNEAYPMIVGGIAGGIAGALIALIVGNALAPRRERQVVVETEAVAPKNNKRFSSFSIQDAVELLMVVAPLAKQIQAWYKGQKQDTEV